MGFFGALVGGFVAALGAIGSAISGIASAVAGSGIFSGIASFAANLASKIGIGSLPLLILTIVDVVTRVAELLGIRKQDDVPMDELAYRAEVSDKKPEDFDSINEYIDFLNNEIELTPEQRKRFENLTEDEKIAYKTVGSAMQIKAIDEKYNITTSEAFWKDVAEMKIKADEVNGYLKAMSETNIKESESITNYLKGNSINENRNTVAETVKTGLKYSYPELSTDEEVEEKLAEIRQNIDNKTAEQ
ncbi:MAG: hypothetical protein K6F77_08255 [Lachnospiraceae bacterium]|nr:hypothetical protein [Lachnospiraceae bacterium]